MDYDEIKERISTAKWRLDRRQKDLRDAELELEMAEGYLANMIEKGKQ